ncbi:Aerotaxis receptor [Frankliniella fusca]|uniref:Aerotaxis receptor n=1 Tax=Frankliniella fusca TaxID=407009 RepID=A0AAE1HFY4_9NEOP|nr:Aerotaxis receptor [Frankliniella fusca]
MRTSAISSEDFDLMGIAKGQPEKASTATRMPIENLMDSSISFANSKMIASCCIFMIGSDGVHYMFGRENKLETLFVWIKTGMFKSSIHDSIMQNKRFKLQPKRSCPWTIAHNVTSLGPYNLPVPSVTPLRRALACFDVGPAADLTTLGTAVVSFPGCFHCFVVDQYFVVDQAVVGDCTGATDYPTGFATTFQHDRTGVDTLEATTATETTTAIKATATSATASAPATASTTATSIGVGGSLALGKIVEPWTALSRAAMREGYLWKANDARIASLFRPCTKACTLS